MFVFELAPQIEELWKRYESGGHTVAIGSPLLADDLVTKPFQLSHAAWHCISHAIDNLHALRRLTLTGEMPKFTVVTHPDLAAGAVEPQRTNHSTLEAPESGRHQQGARAALLLGVPSAREDKERRLARARGVAEARGLSEEQWSRRVDSAR